MWVPNLPAGAFPDDLRPAALEIACGIPINGTPHAPRLPRGPRAGPRPVVEAQVRRALVRPPCLVSFSGGRDSSAILAVAAAVARREGLRLPIPATFRFPDAPATDEAEWQEQVVGHLGLDDWVRITVTDELDSVGPVAQGVLRRHGVLSPFNAHLHVPLLERAGGGSLLTGVGGDELFGPQHWRGAQMVLTGGVRARPRHIRTLGLAFAPRPVRRAVLAHRSGVRWPWLRPHIEKMITRRRAEWQARTPVRWDGAVCWWWRSRARIIVAQTLSLLGDDADAQVVQPFLEPALLSAAASHFGVRGPANRTAAMRALFADVLPDTILARRSKTTFDEVFFANHSRAFAAAWSGGGVDVSLVDPEGVAAVWNAMQPDPRSFSLMQSTWLAQENGLGQQEQR
jgi:asparagine synthase (glutamine-hydrolysing)